MPAGPTILLVEDNESDRLLMQTALHQARVKHSLQVVGDGEEAINYLAGSGSYSDRNKHPLPRLVLLDLGLPKKSGFDVLDWIRQLPMPADFAVVVISASNVPEDVSRAYDLGARSFLVKPANPEELLDLVAPLEGYLHPANGGTSLLTPSLAQQRLDQSRVSSGL